MCYTVNVEKAYPIKLNWDQIQKNCVALAQLSKNHVEWMALFDNCVEFCLGFTQYNYVPASNINALVDCKCIVLVFSLKQLSLFFSAYCQCMQCCHSFTPHLCYNTDLLPLSILCLMFLINNKEMALTISLSLPLIICVILQPDPGECFSSVSAK